MSLFKHALRSYLWALPLIKYAGHEVWVGAGVLRGLKRPARVLLR